MIVWRIYNYDVCSTVKELPRVTRLSKILFVGILWVWRGWKDEFEGGVLNYARTIVAALWVFEVLHSCLLSVPDASRLEWMMDLNVDQPLNGDMTQALTDAQGLLCPWQCFARRNCKTNVRAKTHA